MRIVHFDPESNLLTWTQEHCQNTHNLRLRKFFVLTQGAASAMLIRLLTHTPTTMHLPLIKS